MLRKAQFFFKLYILKDSFLLNFKKWVNDEGDKKLRLDYPLNSLSVVFDVGGYMGDYSEAIFKNYGCKIYLFEPIPSFYKVCVERFRDNPSVICLNYGLSSKTAFVNIGINDDASSFIHFRRGIKTQQAHLKSIDDVFSDLNIKQVDLIKINIEGGEYDLLPAIIDLGLIKNFKYIQVQFHSFIKGAERKRDLIRNALRKTHYEMWSYEFVWESWSVLNERT